MMAEGEMGGRWEQQTMKEGGERERHSEVRARGRRRILRDSFGSTAAKK